MRRNEGSDWIIRRARAGGNRPLWVLVWGSATDVAQALHDDPGIAERIRLYTIGANNTRRDPAARQYILDGLADKWPKLFWIENGDMPNGSRDTFRGVYLGESNRENGVGPRLSRRTCAGRVRRGKPSRWRAREEWD